MGFAHAPRDDRGVGQRHTRGLRGESADLSEPAAAAKDENQPRHVVEITWTSKYVKLLSHTVRHHWTPGPTPHPRHDEGPDRTVGPFVRGAGGAQSSRSTTLTPLAPISVPMSLSTPAGIALSTVSATSAAPPWALRATCMPPMLMSASPSTRPTVPMMPGRSMYVKNAMCSEIGTSRSKPLTPTT